MKEIKVKTTTDYDKFSYISGNRKLDSRHLSKLRHSISEHNMLESNPIIVNKAYEVIDGQHRLGVARELNVPIYYIVANGTDLSQIITMNTAQRGWSIRDYAESYVSLGIRDYQVLLDFCDLYDISITVGVSLLSDRHGTSGKVLDSFKKGEFRATSVKRAEGIADLLHEFKDITESGVVRSRDFIAAIVWLYESDFNGYSIVDNLRMRGKKVEKRGTTRDYIRQLEDVYNFKKRERVYFVYGK